MRIMIKLSRRCGAILLAAAALAGCATQQGGGVAAGADVTRFHLGQPIARGAIAIAPLGDAQAAGGLAFQQDAAAVERELARLGWTVVRPGAQPPEQIALVRLEQGVRDASASGPSIGIGVGGGSGGWRGGGVGVGVGATIPVGGAGARQIVVSELQVRIQRRSDASAIWEGRAVTEARGNAPAAERGAAAALLADALFRDFPGPSGATVRVR
jgi:hypothetical protein